MTISFWCLVPKVVWKRWGLAQMPFGRWTCQDHPYLLWWFFDSEFLSMTSYWNAFSAKSRFTLKGHGLFPSPHGRTFLCPLLVVVVSVGCHWLDGGRCHPDVSARSTSYFWELFSDRMASEEEKAAWTCPVKFKLASKPSRIVTPAVPVGNFYNSRCCRATSDVFWTRRMKLLQQNLRLAMVEISDFEISCFGSVFWVLVPRSFPPSLIHLLHIPIPNATLGTPTMRSKPQEKTVRTVWTVSELECLFHILPNKKIDFFTRFFNVFL